MLGDPSVPSVSEYLDLTILLGGDSWFLAGQVSTESMSPQTPVSSCLLWYQEEP